MVRASISWRFIYPCSRSRVRTRVSPFLFWDDNIRARTNLIRELIRELTQPRFSARSRPSQSINQFERSGGISTLQGWKTHIDANFSGGISTLRLEDPYRGNWKSSLWRRWKMEKQCISIPVKLGLTLLLQGSQETTPKIDKTCALSPPTNTRRGPSNN